MNTIIAEIVNSFDKDLYIEWEERAAIREFDGNMSRDEAELEALFDVVTRHAIPLIPENTENK